MNSTNFSEEINKVTGTPFTIIKGQLGHFVAIGKYRLSEEMEEEDAKEDAKRVDWDRMMQVMGVMIKEFKKD